MNRSGDTSEKTENATPKRLRDARKRGDVPKSKDLSSTLVLAFTISLLWFTFSANFNQLFELLFSVIKVPAEPFAESLSLLGTRAINTFVSICATLLLPIACFSIVVEFLQTGPVFTLANIRPRMSNLSPAVGLKRMFAVDKLVQFLLAVAKTCALLFITYLVVRHFLSELMLLPSAQSTSIALAIRALLLKLILWTAGLFFAMMLLDFVYQRVAYAKKMRMSIREVRQEIRETEANPANKQHRRLLHQDITQQNRIAAAKSATVVVVNPTHVAIAISYDKDENPVPILAAKGEQALARQMRDAANENHVPVLRNERLARTLLANVREGAAVPRELFDIVAQVILWARNTSSLIAHEKIAHEKAQANGQVHLEHAPEPPGENLTVYPAGFTTAQSSSYHSAMATQHNGLLVDTHLDTDLKT